MANTPLRLSCCTASVHRSGRDLGQERLPLQFILKLKKKITVPLKKVQITGCLYMGFKIIILRIQNPKCNTVTGKRTLFSKSA